MQTTLLLSSAILVPLRLSFPGLFPLIASDAAEVACDALLGLDVVVISSSKTVGGTSGPTDDPGTLARAWHTRTLYREVQAIRRRGAAVLVLQPTAGELAGRAARRLHAAQFEQQRQQARLERRALVGEIAADRRLRTELYDTRP